MVEPAGERTVAYPFQWIAAALGALSLLDADSNRHIREATKRDLQVFAVSGAATQPACDGIFPQPLQTNDYDEWVSWVGDHGSTRRARR
jgi:hypothetical protein